MNNHTEINNNGSRRRYVFTINNYSDAEIAHLDTLGASTRIQYLVFGKEVGDNGTPHLQGFVVFSSSIRFTNAKQRIGQRAYLAGAVATSEQAANYCKKDGDFKEYGEVPKNAGKRNDWTAYKEWIEELGRIPTERELINFDTSLYARYSKKCYAIANAYLASPDLVGAGTPRLGWQLTVGALIESENPSARSIHFVVDPDGGKGKSWICRWALTKYPDKVQILRIGKRDDLAYAIDETKRVFIFDIPREQMMYLQYSVLESLKDQMIFSAKYESSLKVLRNPVQVIVFSNEKPDTTQLTDDRFNLIEI